jgi:hypothetical protein
MSQEHLLGAHSGAASTHQGLPAIHEPAYGTLHGVLWPKQRFLDPVPRQRMEGNLCLPGGTSPLTTADAPQ